MLTQEQIIEILEEEQKYTYTYSWSKNKEVEEGSDEGYTALDNDNATFTVDGYKFTTVDHFGGSGKGDDYWVVFSIEKEGEETQFWKIPGWYTSGEGSELNYTEIFRVKPEQVTRTEYNPL